MKMRVSIDEHLCPELVDHLTAFPERSRNRRLIALANRALLDSMNAGGLAEPPRGRAQHKDPTMKSTGNAKPAKTSDVVQSDGKPVSSDDKKPVDNQRANDDFIGGALASTGGEGTEKKLGGNSELSEAVPASEAGSKNATMAPGESLSTGDTSGGDVSGRGSANSLNGVQVIAEVNVPARGRRRLG